jgi:hypothetical protein
MSRYPYPVVFLIMTLLTSFASAQSTEIPSQASPIPGSAEFRRLEKKVFRANVSSSHFPVRLPRIAAPIRQATWTNGNTVKQLDVNPEITYWQLSTKEQLSDSGLVTIEFDATALLLDELEPIKAAADGSFWLAAHLATTIGEKLRYEPQPHKNTVGYWTQSKDKAQWSFHLDRPGKFNVAVLQGCGNGQGGSIATLTMTPKSAASNGETLAQDFEVLETGHFQNFQWKQLQPVELKQTGVYSLEVSPKEIRKNALMDIRAIQLTRLPN